MLTLKRLGIYLITFLVVVSLLIGFVDWKWIDTYFVNEANNTGKQEDHLNKEIVFINLEKPQGPNKAENLKLYRQHIIRFLNTVAIESKKGKAPKGVILDTWFSSDTTELTNLEAALKQLKDLKVPVYASYNVNENNETLDLSKIDFDEIEAEHAVDVYNEYLAGSNGNEHGSGRYHTFFYPDHYVANYENDIYLNSTIFDTSVLIASLAYKAATDLNNSDISYIPKRTGSVVPIHPVDEIANKAYTFIADSFQSSGVFQLPEGFKDSIDTNKNILIAGDPFHEDQLHFTQGEIPGPYVLTWAISDFLGDYKNVKLPIENTYIIIGQILFFSFFSVIIFALLFKYVKSLQTKAALIAVLAFIATMLLLFIYGKLILGFDNVIPAGQTIAATIVATLLSWRFAHKFLVTGVAEGSQKYDVFISYSHSQSDWVFKNVYLPLADFKKPDGDKLNIFFDKKSIGIGEAFTAKYMWAIVDTKCFIPVIFEDYYGKNHCKNELDCAIKRWVEKLLSIQAIVFSYKAVPEAYNGINYLDINANPNFIEAIKSKLSEQ